MSATAGWENFYVIVGSAAGALIGLQFVVMTLIASRPVGAGRSQGADAFATPTIVQFGTALLLSAISCAPWQTYQGLAISYRVLGVLGILYELIVIHRMRVQDTYQPVFEDWFFHALLPVVAYAMLAASTWPLIVGPSNAMFGIAAASLLLLFVGIHNAWDAVMYHVFVGKHDRK